MNKNKKEMIQEVPAQEPSVIKYECPHCHELNKIIVCPNCDWAMTDDANFCEQCGTRLRKILLPYY